jgi:hypothetical protein
MKVVVACLALPFLVAATEALAQDDAMQRLRACSILAAAERVECLDKLSRDIGPPPVSPASGDAEPPAESWVVSETTSPFDYSLIALATTSASGGSDGSGLQLTIQCRGGGTELVLSSVALAQRDKDDAVAYRIDDGAPVPLATGRPASGAGLAVKGDMVRLLAALPDHGTIAFRITRRQEPPLEGRFALASLNATLKRLAAPCKWPSK